MIKTSKFQNTFAGGIDTDSSVNKIDATHYLDAENMRIISNDPQSSGALTTVVGNTLKLQFGNNEVIIGYCKIRNNFNDTDKDSIVFFTRNSSTTRCRIYLLEGDPGRITGSITMNQVFQTVVIATPYKCGYIYEDDGADPLNFSESYPIKAEGRYESANIRKVYWVDGYNNIRYMILDTVNAASPTTIFEINPTATLVEPTVTSEIGGGYKSGMVQYSYQLYIKNGARTTFSPCSNMVTLSGGDSSSNTADNTGTSLGVNTGKSCNISISSIDTDYDRIRIVAIYYTELNTNPVINIVGEFEYNNTSTTLTFIDPGTNIYGTIPLEEFRILGQTDYKADSLATKNNYMFYANTTKTKWNPDFLDPDDATFWDGRAVRYRTWITSSGALSDTATKASLTHDGINVLFERNGADDACILVTISNVYTYFGISGSRLIDSFGVPSSDIVGVLIDGTYTDAGPPAGAYTQTNANCTIANPTLVGDTLTFTVTSTAGDFFVGYAAPGIITGILHSTVAVSFPYDYHIDTVHTEAVVNDLVSGDLTIDVPAGNTPAQWDTAHWDTYETAYDHDGINVFNDIDNDADSTKAYKYQYDGATLGASGKNVKIEFYEENLLIDENSDDKKAVINAPFSGTVADTYKRSWLRDEVYRLYVVFYNTKMQFSNPQWICDLRMPTLDESHSVLISTEIYGKYIYPKITLYNMPADTDLLGWQIFRCERTNADKSVLMRGLASVVDWDGATDIKIATSNTTPYSFIRAQDVGGGDDLAGVVEFLSPEITFNKNISRVSGDKLRIDGRYSTYVATTTTPKADFRTYTLKLKDVTDISATDTPTYGIDDVLIVSNSDPANPTYSIIKTKQFFNYAEHTIVPDDYLGKIGTTMLLGLDSDITVDATTTGFLACSYMRNIHNSRYGGITYEARSYNQVIPCSKYIAKGGAGNITCYYGDTFIQYYVYLRSMFFDQDSLHRFQTMIYLPVETSIDLIHRLDPIQKYTTPQFALLYCVFGMNEKASEGITNFTQRYPLDLGDLYRQNPVYSQVGNAQLIQCRVFDANTIDHIDTEIIATDKKINNEYFDNWTNVFTNNTLWLDSKYGAIRNIFTLNNTMFAGQDKAISQISVEERSMVQDNTKLGLVLGTGDVLSRFDYLTTASGIQNYFDMCITDKSFYYLDRRNKIIYQLSGDGDIPISEVEGYRSFMKSYGAITTVKTGYDPVYKEVFFYITDNTISKTSVFNEYTKTFTGKHTFTPARIFGLNENFYSVTGAQSWIHNYGSYGEFYGVLSDSSVTLIINPNKEIVNRYDVLDLRVDVTSGVTYYDTEQFDHIEVSNSNPNQNFTKTISFTGVDTDTTRDITRKWRVWLVPDDLNVDFFRMVDTYIKVKLVRHNTGNKKLTCHDVVTYYRPTKN